MTAVLSDCLRYRYRLERTLNGGGLLGTVAFIGVNPSTADASLDDATVRKWKGFAHRWGYDHIVVGNLFAWRSTDVKALAAAEDPVGPDNDQHLAALLTGADLIVPCWGNASKLPPRLRPRIDQVKALLQATQTPIAVLGLTGSQDPKHPLMLGYATPLVPWAL